MIVTLRRAAFILLLALLVSLAQAQETAVVIDMGATLRLRAQPTTRAEVLAYLQPNTPLLVLARSEGGLWLQVSTPQGLTGWVLAEYTRIVTSEGQSAPSVPPNVPFNAYSLVSNITDTARTIHRQGRELGARPNIFSKVGDSITAAPQNLNPIGRGQYILGDYGYLQGAIDFFSGAFARDHDSFANGSLAAYPGWTTRSVLDASNSNPNLCLRDETPIACELRLVRPGFVLIMFGTNDMTLIDSNLYRNSLIEIAKLSIERGAVPVLSTIPPRTNYEGSLARTEEFNTIIRQISIEMDIPLIDYYSAMLTLPNYGLEPDGVHPNSAYLGLRGAADFRAKNLAYGYVMRNLLQLHALDRLWREVVMGI
ncbi:MAG: GDSL-type esterase/lipase family protein [Anaerolineae bacterium]|nr:GDSL-type esterase/lipase family protein [Anaerolineae bacterium]MDW8172952.1 GDSL-type esterase/lipase family protein [Anaerolineae bacterium]